MKLKTIITVLMTLALAFISQQTFAQKVSLKAENQRYADVFKEIQAQTSMKFAYNNSVIDPNRRVSITAENEELSSVLSRLFKGTTVEFRIVEKQILLSTKEDLITKKVKGTITDSENGEPLAGALIVVKGEDRYVLTDENGNFEIDARTGDILEASLLGMTTLDAVVGVRSQLDFILEPDIINLENLVVTGYQTISKERSTGSFDNVGKALLDKPQVSVESSLIGNVAGLQMINKGYSSDRDEQIVIRGVTSLGANANPLIVVDGFAIEGSLSSLNPNDIASITVLKDAAAASIWGARSANGVIVVTTKSASKGKVNVELNAFVKFSNYLDQSYANPKASSAETIEYEQRGFNTNFFNAGRLMADNYSSSIYNGYGNLYSGATVLMNEARLGYLSQDELKQQLNRLSNSNNQEQIKKYLLDRPLTQQYNLTVSGGTERLDNILTVMFEDNRSNFKGTGNDKYTVNYRSNLSLFKWLDFSFSSMFQYTSSTNNGISLQDIQNMSPYDLLIGDNDEYLHVQNNIYLPIIYRRITQQGVTFPYDDWTYNPVQEMRSRNIRNKSIYGRFQAGLTFKIIKGLTFDSKIQYELMNNTDKALYGEDSYKVRFGVNYASEWNGDPYTPVSQNWANGMAIQEGSNTLNAYDLRNQLTFDRTFKDKHSVSAILGTEVSNRVFENNSGSLMYGYNDELLSITAPLNGIASGYNYLYDMFGGYNYYGPSYPAPNKSYTTDRYFSAYGNVSYTYDDRYTISGSARADASNLISSDPTIRYSPFWSVGASWNIGNEKFMKSVSWLDRLALRATYGFNGNVNNSSSVDPLISVWGQDYLYGTGYGIISNYGNPYLGWEKTGALDIGIDYSFLQGKIFGKLDFYDKEGSDLISEVSVANVYGADSQSMNAVKMYNRGIELVVGSSLSKGDFNWTGNLSFSYNKNKITELYKDKATLAYRVYGPGSGWEYAQGYDASTLWCFKYGGIVDGQPVIVDKNGENPRMMTTYNTSFDSEDYLVSAGPSVAPYVVGLNSAFTYRGFRLSFIITGYFGHVFKRTGFNYPNMENGIGNINKYYSEIADCDPNEFIPLPDFESGQIYPSYLSDYSDIIDYLYLNAANIRFQEINLTYSLSKKALKKAGIQGLSIYAQLNNLGVITFNKYHEDPFYPMGTLKPSASYTFGLKFNF